MQDQKVDVLVIGGGIIGTCVARELQSQGRQVTLIDRGGIASGCSHGNAGWITPCFAMPLPQPGMFFKSIGWLLDPQSPLYIKPELRLGLARWLFHFTTSMTTSKMNRSITVLTEISKYSLDFYSEHAKRAKAKIDFEKRGLLLVSGTDAGLKAAKMEMELMSARGIPGRLLGRDELLAFEPSLRPLIKGGVFFNEEAHVEPHEVTDSLFAEFQSLGGKASLNTEVFDFELNGSKIERVITTKGNYKPDLVVLAAGSWSPPLAKKLQIRLPIMGGKGYSMTVHEHEVKPQRPIMIVERKIAVTPRSEGTRIAGTLELVNQDYGISPNRVYAIQKGAQEYLKMNSMTGSVDIWRGLRPCTPDGVPVISFSKKYNNLFYNTGHQMLGLQSAPGSAKLAADLIAGKTPMTDPKPFSADRYE